MNEIMTIMILDAFMAFLLIVTIFYCFKLNGRIRILQDSKSEFSKLIEKFDATTSRAQQSIEELQTVSQKVNAELSTRLDKANFLADDLAFMIERGGKVANKIEGRAAAKPQPAKPSRSDAATSEPKKSSRRAMPARGSNKGVDESSRDRKRASLESILNRNSSRDDAGGGKRKKAGVSARLRSKAEQELYEALKSEE